MAAISSQINPAPLTSDYIEIPTGFADRHRAVRRDETQNEANATPGRTQRGGVVNRPVEATP